MDFSHPVALLDGSASSQDESASRNGSKDRSTSSESVYETASEFGTNTEIPIRCAEGDDAQQVQGAIAMDSSGTAAGPGGSADQASFSPDRATLSAFTQQQDQASPSSHVSDMSALTEVKIEPEEGTKPPVSHGMPDGLPLGDDRWLASNRSQLPKIKIRPTDEPHDRKAPRFHPDHGTYYFKANTSPETPFGGFAKVDLPPLTFEPNTEPRLNTTLEELMELRKQSVEARAKLNANRPA